MTFFDFIKRCLHIEAIRTEPDPGPVIETIMGDKKKNGTEETDTTN